MKKNETAQSGFFNLRALIALGIFSTGIILALAAMANLLSSARGQAVSLHRLARLLNGDQFLPPGVQQAWVARYNGPANGGDSAVAMAIDGSGNIYVTGGSDSNITPDFITIKYDSTGQEQWVARLSGSDNTAEFANAIAIDGSGNVYVTGVGWGYDNHSDFATVKYDSSGQQQWVARYHGSANGLDTAMAIAVDGPGNAYVTGYSTGSDTDYDYATIKYNSLGQEEWVARYNGPGNSDDAGRAIAVDGLGNVYVTGQSIGSGTGADYTTIKYDTSGKEKWVARYNGPGNGADAAFDIAIDGSGNIYVTGASVGTTIDDFDYATLKYNSDGQEQWVARYDRFGNGSDEAMALALDGSSNVYVTGRSRDPSTNYEYYVTIKYNSSGEEQWASSYSGPDNGYHIALAIAVDSSGNAYVTGGSRDGNTSDYATVKYNALGTEEWVARYNGPGDSEDQAAGIAVDGSGNVYVMGTSVRSGTNTDYATIKYVQGTTPTPTPTATPTPRPTPIPRLHPTPPRRPTPR